MLLKNALKTMTGGVRRISLLSLLAFLPLLASACMVWPGLTAVLVDRPDDSQSNVPLLLALIGGGSGRGTSVPCWQTGECRIFVTSGFWTPNPGGLTSADTFCQSEANGLSFAGTYKALLMTEDLARDITHSWVMYPNIVYRTASNGNAIVGTTNAQSIFPFPLQNPIYAISTLYTWTGATTVWAVNSGNTCSNWTQPSGAWTGSNGNSYWTDSTMIDTAGPDQCSTASLHLYCVQQ